MGTIINLRGVSGSGKTELARRLLRDYGWNSTGFAKPLRRPGRELPIGYRLPHPSGGPPLIVLGHYERTSGGCDTIRAVDGGLDEIHRLADIWASEGHDVLLEGAAWSAEHIRSAALAARHSFHVLLLSTTVEQCARNLVARRRSGGRAYPKLLKALREQESAVQAACSKLQASAAIKPLNFEGALIRARELLGVPRALESSAGRSAPVSRANNGPRGRDTDATEFSQTLCP